jgi:hypothetical protein
MTVPRNVVHYVTYCWWPAVNKAVSPCDLSTIFVQLLSEHPVQVIHKLLMAKSKASNIKYTLYTIRIQWTGGDVMNWFC